MCMCMIETFRAHIYEIFLVMINEAMASQSVSHSVPYLTPRDRSLAILVPAKEGFLILIARSRGLNGSALICTDCHDH